MPLSVTPNEQNMLICMLCFQGIWIVLACFGYLAVYRLRSRLLAQAADAAGGLQEQQARVEALRQQVGQLESLLRETRSHEHTPTRRSHDQVAVLASRGLGARHVARELGMPLPHVELLLKLHALRAPLEPEPPRAVSGNTGALVAKGHQ